MERDPIPPTVEWRRGRIRLIDQRQLPARLRFVECTTVDDVCRAIRSMVVRGAPALGATGAYGVALAARRERTPAAVQRASARLCATRPTAVNLAWGTGRVVDAYERSGPDGALMEAHRIARADVAANRAIGRYGAELLADGSRVLTHCNAGALACVGYGTALGVIRAAHDAGKRPRVWVDETRPALQGARLTAWELDRLGVDATLVADSMAGSLMRGGEVDVVVVGADRIAANGDVANKIGTYALAVLASHHDVPFFVAAPTSTVDLATPDGSAIVVEERDTDEILRMAGTRVAPARASALNRAFDVTPARLVTGIVTEQGIARRPYRRSLARLVRAAASHDAAVLSSDDA